MAIFVVSSNIMAIFEVFPKSYYALPSRCVKVTIDDQISVSVLLDNGSELNIIPRRIFKQIDIGINTDIE